jgi:hypothetical protein
MQNFMGSILRLNISLEYFCAELKYIKYVLILIKSSNSTRHCGTAFRLTVVCPNAPNSINLFSDRRGLQKWRIGRQKATGQRM